MPYIIGCYDNFRAGIPRDTSQRTYDKNNRLMTETEQTTLTKYYYDPNGNTTAKNTMSIASTGGEKVSIGAFAVTNTDVTLYNYNGLNQLVSVSENGLTSSYTYDGTGLGQSKTVNGTTTSHIWDGTNIAADVTGGTVTKYIRGVQLISAKTGSTESFYNYNGHGDVVQLTNSSGTVTKQYGYDAFGNEMNKVDSDTNPFRYCGEYYDKEIDSIYLRARYYKPVTGRFITEDPVKDGLNWYAYCDSNPVNFVDPFGLAGSQGYQETVIYLTYLIYNKLSYQNTDKDYYTGGTMYATASQYEAALNSYKANGETARNKIMEYDFLPEPIKQIASEVFSSYGYGSVKEVNALLVLTKEYNDEVVMASHKWLSPPKKTYDEYKNRFNEIVSEENNLYYVTLLRPKLKKLIPTINKDISLNKEIAKLWLKVEQLSGFGPNYESNGRKFIHKGVKIEEIENNDEEYGYPEGM